MYRHLFIMDSTEHCHGYKDVTNHFLWSPSFTVHSSTVERSIINEGSYTVQ